MVTRVPRVKVSPKQQELGDKEVDGRIHTEQWDYLVTPGFKILFILGCAGSSLLSAGFLWLWSASCGAWASYCNGFSCCPAQALGLQ